ncbi:hypothetical protein KIW84_055921 [Lathyrus oleraceus]|uniref:Uncharacterized protein n=1 Tax=Pisum sativum TaxID=3888 RepID=A0A9D5AKJ4_PEA|nr:hypothetical protein KIW84_055921 [Pisum sativum]
MVKLLGQAVDDKMATFQSIITPSRMIVGYEWPTLMEVLGSPVSRVSDHQTKEFGGLLDRLVIVFKEIQGLPPPRNTSHSIELLHGAGPEEELLLKSQFPDLRLEDKANVVGGGDDRNESEPTSDDGDVLVNKDNFGPKQWRVYARKNKKGPVN